MLAPDGGPSLASQARAAELNAAAAARARIRRGDLTEGRPRIANTLHSHGPWGSPVTQKIETFNIEGFKRPNRPLERYYFPVQSPIPPTPPTPVIPTYALQQPQYMEPGGAGPVVYGSAPYAHAPDYYHPMYQPMQAYQHVYPGRMTDYQVAASPPPPHPPRRGQDRLDFIQPAILRTANTTPVKLFLPEPIQRLATPSVASNGCSSPAKSLSRAPSPVITPKVEQAKIFTPDDLSPAKFEVDIMRYKAEVANIEPSDSVKSPENVTEQTPSDKKSPADGKNVGDGFGEKESQDFGDKESVGHRQQYAGVFGVRVPDRNDQLTVEAYRKPGNRAAVKDSPLIQRAHKRLISNVVGPDLSPLGVASHAETTLEMHLKTEQEQKSHWTNQLELTSVNTQIEQLLRSRSKILKSPFQHRPRSPVEYYKPIVNKYPRNIFASRALRVEELRKLEQGRTWLGFRDRPRVQNFPGSFSRVHENTQRAPTTNLAVPIPPPGLFDPGFIDHGSTSTTQFRHWNLASGPTKDISNYYERVLEAEDWFHQSIAGDMKANKEGGSRTAGSENLAQVHSVMVRGTKSFSLLSSSSKNKKVPQIADLVISSILHNLSAYLDRTENGRRGFEFSNSDLLVTDRDPTATVLKGRHRRGRNYRRKRTTFGGEFVKRDGIAARK